METALLTPDIQGPETWPSDVRLIISVLEQDDQSIDDRRSHQRNPYCVKAGLVIVNGSHIRMQDAISIFTRDANARGLRFVSNRPLPVAVRARLYLPSPADRPRSVDCSIIRCRSFVDGWFEGAVIFEFEQPMFEPAVAC